jgi:predicted nucleic acid-binding protein
VIVLDASIVIAHLDGADAHHARAVELLTAGIDEALLISPITLAECYVGPARSGRLDDARTQITRLEIGVVPLSEDAPERLAMLRARTGIRLPDCCVLLAADTAAAEVATFDNRLSQAARTIGLTVRE